MNNNTIGNSLEDISTPFVETYLSNDELTISTPVKNYLVKLRSKNAQIPKHIKRYWDFHYESQLNIYFDYFNMLKLVLTGTAFKEAVDV